MGCFPNVGLLIGGLFVLWLVSQVVSVVIWIVGVGATALITA